MVKRKMMRSAVAPVGLALPTSFATHQNQLDFFGLKQGACSATQFCESSLDCPDGTCPAGFCVPKASQESGRKDKEFCGERNISECHDDLIRKYCPDLCKGSSIENLRAHEVDEDAVHGRIASN